MSSQLQPRPALFKIKSGKLEQWLAWCEELQTTLADQASQTIAEEGELFEFFVVFQVDGVHYTLGAGITPGGSDPKTAVASTAINQRHRQMKAECLEFVGKGEFVYFLEGHSQPFSEPTAA